MDIQILKDNMKIINDLGYKIKSIKNEIVKINAIPDTFKVAETQEFIELIIDSIKHSNANIHESIIKKIAKKIAYQKTTQINLPNNTNSLIQQINKLMKCEMPFIGIDGNPLLFSIEPNKIFN